MQGINYEAHNLPRERKPLPKTEWLEMQQNDSSAKEHYRFFIFLIHSTYAMFKRTDNNEIKRKLGEQLISNFEENCLNSVLSSLEFGHVDIARTYLEVCLHMEKFEKITNFCRQFLENKSEFELPYNFREILVVAHLTSALEQQKKIDEKDCNAIRANLNKLQKALNVLGETSSGRKLFWLRESVKTQYDFHKKMGLLDEFRRIRSSSTFFLPTLYDQCCSIDNGSNDSLITSLNEIVKIEIQSVKFLLLRKLFLNTNSHSGKLSAKLELSYKHLQYVLATKFKLRKSNFIESWDREIRPNTELESEGGHSSYVIILQMVAGNSTHYYSLRFPGYKFSDTLFFVESILRNILRSDAKLVSLHKTFEQMNRKKSSQKYGGWKFHNNSDLVIRFLSRFKVAPRVDQNYLP